MDMKVKREVTVINKLGLHARASAQLVKLAGTYASDVRLTLGEQSVDGKNIMGLMMLAATFGSRIIVTAEGEDAGQAVERIDALFSERFGEPE
jgi:phosphocarrier protein